MRTARGRDPVHHLEAMDPRSSMPSESRSRADGRGAWREPAAEDGRRCAVALLGLDFGSTTSSAMAATAQVRASAGVRAYGVQDVTVRGAPSRCHPAARRGAGPRRDRRADRRLARRGGPRRRRRFAGGAIVTGLAARRRNARGLTALRRRAARRGGDRHRRRTPRSSPGWPFIGSAAALSRALHRDARSSTSTSAAAPPTPPSASTGRSWRPAATCRAPRHCASRRRPRRLVGRIAARRGAAGAALGIAGPEPSRRPRSRRWSPGRSLRSRRSPPASGAGRAAGAAGPGRRGRPDRRLLGGVGELVYAAQRPAGPARHTATSAVSSPPPSCTPSASPPTSPTHVPSTAAARPCTA